ncbi:glycosyltransferase family 4 protein [Vibrio cholerae]|uniref:glycosyltransferase family 4 protein n=1 Tax=Vibrio cholerae TaxID=666 RepID=UPI002046D738|nr:glycosyltransferase family 4 protein [Vibrio cholerae]EKE8762688.1 glycosyltransferase family 4 protein [Vibrio cholerae]EKF9658965.1 glycosyltransferase family 4 protein [Vibrio cholerae]EKF9677844.1 glycosyltransferase family 4 protein [Vibrio cholerae]BCN17235.1 putative glycosyltransferase [Vibrio cholerae]
MKNKKILYVVNSDWYFNLHWKERAVNAIENGFAVHVALPSCDSSVASELDLLGITTHKFDMNRSSLNIIGEVCSVFSLNRVFNIVEPDIVHSVTIKPNLYSSVLCRLKKIKLLSTYAGLGTLKSSSTISYVIARFLIFNVIKWSSKKQFNIALFENEEDLDYFKINNILPNERLIRVFGAGVNLERYSYSSVSKLNSELNVLFASRLLKDKGLDCLIEAVKLLKKKGYKVNLYVAGIFDPDSPLSYTREQIRAFSDSGDIIWLGKRDDIPDLIQQSDVVALPTTYGEGIPRILIESCAVGRPIITTPLGGCKDICNDGINGYLVIPHNGESVASSLEKLILDPDNIDIMGKKGRELVEAYFSNESIFAQNISFYKKMVDN